MRLVPFLRTGLKRILIALVPCVLVYTWAVVAVIQGYSGTAHLPADCALVFGAAVRSSYDQKGHVIGVTAGPGIRRRVETAVALYRQAQVKFLVFSGGYGNYRHDSEAEVMAAYAQELGLPRASFQLEERSRSTLENIRYSHPLLSGCRSTVAVSDRYHLRRIQLLAHKLGWPSLQTVPASTHPDPLFETRAVLREALGLLWYQVAL